MSETGTRARTRRAILDAAVAVLSKNASASLGDIAAAADVGRTTVHRYFKERSDLLAALSVYASEQVVAAGERARLDDGSAPEALARLCRELFELGDLLMLLFVDPPIVEWPDWDEETDFDRAMLRVIERGQGDGTIDPAGPPIWIQHIMWALIYSAWEHVRNNGASKHDALALCERAIRKSLAP